MDDRTDFNYYRTVVNTQTDGVILNSELNDLIKEAEAEVRGLRTRVKALEEYVDGNDLMSDFPTASAMRRELNQQRERAEKANYGFKELSEEIDEVRDILKAVTPDEDHGDYKGTTTMAEEVVAALKGLRERVEKTAETWKDRACHPATGMFEEQILLSHAKGLRALADGEKKAAR